MPRSVLFLNVNKLRNRVSSTSFFGTTAIDKDKTTWSRVGDTYLGTNTVNFFVNCLCSDINCCGHTSKYVVSSVKVSFGQIKRFVPKLKCMPFEDNAGNRGSVQSMSNLLISKGILKPWSWIINYFVHVLSKCIKRAYEAIFGRQIMG